MAASNTRFTQNSLGQSKNPIDSDHGIYRDRPRCKGKELDVCAKRSGAAMYSASECSRSGRGP
jgi:hypothetical protein